MEIKAVTEQDREFVFNIDMHINEVTWRNRVFTKSGYIIWENGERAGLISHCVLWDNLPFMNLIFVAEKHRGKGLASAAITAWESEMRSQGYKMTLISTQVDESPQHLYRKLGYVDCGSLLFNGTPMEQPMEMFLRKVL